MMTKTDILPCLIAVALTTACVFDQDLGNDGASGAAGTGGAKGGAGGAGGGSGGLAGGTAGTSGGTGGAAGGSGGATGGAGGATGGAGGATGGAGGATGGVGGAGLTGGTAGAGAAGGVGGGSACPATTTALPLATEPSSAAFTSIAIDGDYVYWNREAHPLNGGTKIVRVKKTGGAPSDVLAGSQLYATSIVVDAASVYFARNTDVNKVAKTGGSWITLAGATGATGLTLDPSANFVLWTNWAACNTDCGVKRATIGGSPVATVASVAYAGSLAADATDVYFMTLSEVLKAPMLSGGTPLKLASIDSNSTSHALAIDADYVYWVADKSALVSRVAKAGGTPENLHVGTKSAPGTSVDTMIALDAGNVYFVDPGINLPDSEGGKDGAILRVPKSAGAVQTVYPFPRTTKVRGLALDAAASCLYFTTSSSTAAVMAIKTP